MPRVATPDIADQPDATELVTVVVPARDEEVDLPACLRSIAAQDHLCLQVVVVVDGRSSDGTSAIAHAFARTDPRFEVIEGVVGGIPVSLNCGLSVARGVWFVRVDAHSTVPPSYVSSLLGHLRSGRWGGVGGRKDADAGTGGATARAIAAALGSPAGVGNSAYHYATSPRTVDHIPFGAYPTEMLRRLGGWNEDLEANEDYELDLRVREDGGVLLLDPRIRVRWRCRRTLTGLARQYHRYGAGKADVARLHPSSLAFRHLAPPAAVAWIAASAAATSVDRRASWLIAPYVAFLAAAGAVTALRARPPVSVPRVVAALAVMHLAWGIGFLRRVGAGLIGTGSLAQRQPVGGATS